MQYTRTKIINTQCLYRAVDRYRGNFKWTRAWLNKKTSRAGSIVLAYYKDEYTQVHAHNDR